MNGFQAAAIAVIIQAFIGLSKKYRSNILELGIIIGTAIFCILIQSCNILTIRNNNDFSFNFRRNNSDVSRNC